MRMDWPTMRAIITSSALGRISRISGKKDVKTAIGAAGVQQSRKELLKEKLGPVVIVTHLVVRAPAAWIPSDNADVEAEV